MTNLANILSSDAFLPISKTLLHNIKDIHTVMLMTYLVDKYKYFKKRNMLSIYDNKEFFFNIHNDIEKNVYISVKIQRRCIATLKKLGLIETKLKGIPAKVFYHINFDVLYQFLNSDENLEINNDEQIDYTTQKETTLQDSPKSNNLTEPKDHILLNNPELKNTLPKNKEEEQEIILPRKMSSPKEIIKFFISEGKKRYLDYIYLTEIEYSQIQQIPDYNNLMIYFNDYIANEKHFKRYISHYTALCKWNSNNKDKNKTTPAPATKGLKYESLDEEMSDYWNKVSRGEIKIKTGVYVNDSFE